MNKLYECAKCKEMVSLKDFSGEDRICQGCASNIIYEDIDENYIQLEDYRGIYKLPRYMFKEN